MPKGEWEYCKAVLPKVSRTFALNIGVLRGELHRSVLLVYLICRILDTVEDSPSLPASLKSKLLRRFPSLMEEENWDPALSEWLSQLRQARLDGEADHVDLVFHSSAVLSCFKALAPPYQRAGERLFSIMAPGMASHIERFLNREYVILKDVEDLRRYCYYVAGSVGEFLMEVFRLAYPFKDREIEVMERFCVDCGLGLQMTNIAKDVVRDLSRGHIFLPESFLGEAGLSVDEFLKDQGSPSVSEAHEKLILEAHVHLQRAQEFILAVPRRYVRLRLFCLWPVWMAFETLAALASSPDLFHSKRDIKISRNRVKEVLLLGLLSAPSNTLIRWRFWRRYEKLTNRR